MTLNFIECTREQYDNLFPVTPDELTITVVENLAQRTGRGKGSQVVSSDSSGTKTIEYTKVDDSTGYWNPETPGSFKIKYGSTLYITFKSGTSTYASQIGFRAPDGTFIARPGDVGKIVKANIDVTDDLTLSYYDDSKNSVEDTYFWYVQYNRS